MTVPGASQRMQAEFLRPLCGSHGLLPFLSMKITQSRELIEAIRLLGKDRVGFAYAETKNTQLQALSVDGVANLIKIGIFNNGEVYTNFGSLGGCYNTSEGDALAEIQQSLK